MVQQAYASFMAARAQQPAHVEALKACAALHKACSMLDEAAAALQLAHEAAGEDAAISEALSAVLTDIGTPAHFLLCEHACVHVRTCVSMCDRVCVCERVYMYACALLLAGWLAQYWLHCCW